MIYRTHTHDLANLIDRVTSGSGCDCSEGSKEVRVHQSLTLKDDGTGRGVVDEDKSSLEVVGPEFGVDVHGGWPK